MTRSLRRPSLLGLFLAAAVVSSSLAASPALAEPPQSNPGRTRLLRLSSYPVRAPHALAFDRGRGRVVMHQQRPLAEGAKPVAETWELVGDSFELVSDKGPIPTEAPQMAYDEKRGVSVLFAAAGPSGQLAMWEWDGVEWTENKNVPPAFSGDSVVFVYHRALEKILFYEPFHRELALFDGQTWDKIPPLGTLPPPGNFISGAYDEDHDQLVLYSGAFETPQKTVWTWSKPEGWKAISPKGAAPKARFGASMFFDEVRRQVVVHGGGTSGALEENTDTWSWDGAGWNLIASKGGPASALASVVWDGVGQRALMVGSWGSFMAPFRYHTLEGTSWQEHRMSAHQPEGRTRHLFLADDDGTLLLFGGQNGLEKRQLTDTWRHREGAWEPVVGESPQANLGFAAAPLAGGGVLLFGGLNASGFSGETWAFQGGAWSPRPSAAGPSARHGAAMARDSEGTVWLFGGRDASGEQGDLWRWDGATWQPAQEQEGPRPEKREDAVFIHHPGVGRTILFGGASGLGWLVDTWAWDGQRWEQVQTTEHPGSFLGLRGVYDEKRRAVLLNAFGELWSFDGASWSREPLGGAEFLMPWAALAAGKGGTVVFGGNLPWFESNGVMHQLHLEGQPCSAEQPCPAGTCVDGVCCEQSACGFCEACNVPGREGSCVALAGGEKDTDSCAANQVCDGKGGCKQALGEACSAASDCADAFCTGGFCCLEQACGDACRSCRGQATGVCELIIGETNPGQCDGGNRCDASGLCKKDEGSGCQQGDECASGRCEQGQCVERQARLCLPGNIALLGDGTRVPCGAYGCDGGACRQRCESTADCSPGARCDGANRCILGDISATEPPGCSMRAGATGGARYLLWLALAALALRRRLAPLAALLGLLGAPSIAEAKPTVELRIHTPAYFVLNKSALALDTSTGKTLFYGGLAPPLNVASGVGDIRDEFWSWDGVTYHRLDGSGPGPGLPQGFVHDRKTDRFLLVNNGALWQWDRSSWSPVPTLLSPSLQSQDALHWDEQGQRVLLVHPASKAEKILAFEGGEWQPLPSSAGGPQPRVEATIGWDPVRRVAVVAGGQLPDGSFLQDVWEWDGSTWKERTASEGAFWPPLNVVARTSYHPGLQRLVICGGLVTTSAQLSLSPDCFTWDGTSWGTLPPVPAPLTHALRVFYDPRRATLVAQSRNDVSPEGNTAMELTEQGWQWVPPADEPLAAGAPAGAYDPTAKQVLFHGGITITSQLSAVTWLFSDDAWRRLPLGAQGPPGLHYESMAFDPALGGILLFGGATLDYKRSDRMWLFKGGTWSELNPTSRPPPRYGARMVTDSKRGRVLLFGGSEGPPNGPSADTWGWDGITWTRLFPPKKPAPARALPLFVLDPARDRVVLFGGRDADLVLLGDTWEFDGETWERKTPAHSPPPLLDPSSYYDPHIKRVILMGGLISQSPTTTTNSIWSWDGVDWEELSHEPRLGTNSDSAAVYSPELGGALMLTGFGVQDEIKDFGVRFARVVGNTCETGETCSTGVCTDGVCCVESSCGLCRACDVPGAEGSCTARPRGSPDARCAQEQVCGDERCQTRIGAACGGDDECLSGSCVDGVCCARAACGECESCAVPGREGACVPVLDAPDPDTCSGDSRCDAAGQCLLTEEQPCAADKACASKVCLDGQCKPVAPPYCDGDHTLYSAAGTFDCGAYRCSPDGTCRQACQSTSDCASEHRCDAGGVCVRELVSVSEPGCAVVPGAERSWALAGLALLGLLGGLRRRPR